MSFMSCTCDLQDSCGVNVGTYLWDNLWRDIKKIRPQCDPCLTKRLLSEHSIWGKLNMKGEGVLLLRGRCFLRCTWRQIHASKMIYSFTDRLQYIIRLTNRFYFQKSSMNDHSMFVRRSTDVNSTVAVFSVVYIKTAICYCTASLGEWWGWRLVPFDLRGRVTKHTTL